jgi:hypothetical protein
VTILREIVRSPAEILVLQVLICRYGDTDYVTTLQFFIRENYVRTLMRVREMIDYYNNRN